MSFGPIEYGEKDTLRYGPAIFRSETEGVIFPAFYRSKPPMAAPGLLGPGPARRFGRFTAVIPRMCGKVGTHSRNPHASWLRTHVFLQGLGGKWSIYLSIYPFIYLRSRTSPKFRSSRSTRLPPVGGGASVASSARSAPPFCRLIFAERPSTRFALRARKRANSQVSPLPAARPARPRRPPPPTGTRNPGEEPQRGPRPTPAWQLLGAEKGGFA